MDTDHSTCVPVQWKIINVIICLSLLGFTTISCSSSTTKSPTIVPTSTPFIPSIDALVTFRVSLPEPLPLGDTLYLTILDEVTGLGLNPKRYIMEAEDDTHYFVILPFVMGSMIQYRYHRQGSILAQEHLPDGRPVRYRLFHVEGPGMIEDIVSRWTDTSFHSPSGELRGRIIDASTGKPQPSIMISAGGHQVYTRADGSFLIRPIPSGTHNLVTFALNGAYQPLQQGALIQADTSTYAEIYVRPSKFITATFLVNLPEDTPPNIPARLAGNLYQLGNSFTDLSGGINSLVSRMPTLSETRDGRYTISLSLPVGTDLRYKYTLGDGLWNSERTGSGEFALRQVIVPDHDIQIQDIVYAWSFGTRGNIFFDTHIPKSTPPDDVVFIQFDPGFGWTEPIPMWGQPATDGSSVWYYTLSSPLDMFTTLRYRFCLEGQCELAASLDQPGLSEQDYAITLIDEPQTVTTEITAWSGQPGSTQPAIIPNVAVIPRTGDFTAGIAFQESYRPSWGTKIPLAISEVKNLNANWIFLQPTWSYTNYTPPTLEFSPSVSPGWTELVNWINHAHLLSLNTALFPLPIFNQPPTDWQGAPRSDAHEWDIWFENYSQMVIHFAMLSAETGAEALVIGDSWITPPYTYEPAQVLPFDTTPAWRELIENLRRLYPGKLIWAISYPDGIASPPSFLNLVDEIYVLWSTPLATQPGASSRQMRDEALRLIDRDLTPFWQLTSKPIILAVAYPSSSMTEQMDAYNAIMMALNDRSWLQGIVSTGYYPPLPLQDSSASVHGKPASGVLWYWFPLFLGK